MLYTILRDGEMDGLIKKVNKRIKSGWIPIGGVSICTGYGHAHFHQAMTRGGKS